MLENLKLVLGVTDKDTLLEYYLGLATEEVADFTNQEPNYCIEHLAGAIVELAEVTYNRKGTEGLISQGYSGVSESYLDGIPERIKNKLYAHRRCRK